MAPLARPARDKWVFVRTSPQTVTEIREAAVTCGLVRRDDLDAWVATQPPTGRFAAQR
jgi:hypothetical protein